MQCPVCDSKKIKTQLEKEAHPLALCFGCTHLWQADREITVSYDENYINAYFKHNSLRIMSILRAGLCESFIGNSLPTGNLKILDFGYGSGDFLRVMSLSGWKTFGIDVHGLNLGIEELKVEDLKNHKLKMVTFFDSLEHLKDFSILDTLESETIVVSVPIFEEKISEIIKWKHYKPGEHLHYFSMDSIKTLMNRYGWSFCGKTFSEDIIRGKINGNQNITTLFFEETS